MRPARLLGAPLVRPQSPRRLKLQAANIAHMLPRVPLRRRRALPRPASVIVIASLREHRVSAHLRQRLRLLILLLPSLFLLSLLPFLHSGTEALNFYFCTMYSNLGSASFGPKIGKQRNFLPPCFLVHLDDKFQFWVQKKNLQ